jgi:hypothetical protein
VDFGGVQVADGMLLIWSKKGHDDAIWWSPISVRVRWCDMVAYHKTNCRLEERTSVGQWTLSIQSADTGNRSDRKRDIFGHGISVSAP